jgi:hypothetical protein
MKAAHDTPALPVEFGVPLGIPNRLSQVAGFSCGTAFN